MAQAEVVSFSEPFTGDIDNEIERRIQFIRNNVEQEDKIFVPVSGGIDSRVSLKLFQKAVPNKIIPKFVDTGYMRIINGVEEPQLVADSFKDVPNFRVVDAREKFYKNTFGIADAEEKRKAFRGTYNDVMRGLAEEFDCLVATDGTIGPDRVETLGGTYKGVKIGFTKTQHNVGDDPFEKKIVPLASLSKDEVRILGRSLGIPEELLWRQPFPGPGLSIRTVGEINMDKLDTEKKANDRVELEIERYFKEVYGNAFLYDGKLGERIPFQYFAATFDSVVNDSTSLGEEINEHVSRLLGKKSVETSILKAKATGTKLKGDTLERAYEPVAVMKFKKYLDPSILRHIGETVPEEFPVSRVLQEVSRRVLNIDTNYTVGIRAIKSRTVLTADPLTLTAFKYQNENMGYRTLRQNPHVANVCIDLTPKPPGTVEFE